jgi:hypothetical protein
MKANDTDICEESHCELAADALKDAARRELAAGVLKQAAQDLRRFQGATSKIERELYLDAYRWFTVGECASPFSFVNVCQLLNLAPDNIRKEVVSDPSLGAFSYWMRRCEHAAIRLWISFRQLFVNQGNARTRIPIGYAELADMVFNNAASVRGAYLNENVH